MAGPASTLRSGLRSVPPNPSWIDGVAPVHPFGLSPAVRVPRASRRPSLRSSPRVPAQRAAPTSRLKGPARRVPPTKLTGLVTGPRDTSGPAPSSSTTSACRRPSRKGSSSASARVSARGRPAGSAPGRPRPARAISPLPPRLFISPVRLVPEAPKRSCALRRPATGPPPARPAIAASVIVPSPEIAAAPPWRLRVAPPAIRPPASAPERSLRVRASPSRLARSAAPVATNPRPRSRASTRRASETGGRPAGIGANRPAGSTGRTVAPASSGRESRARVRFPPISPSGPPVRSAETGWPAMRPTSPARASGPARARRRLTSAGSGPGNRRASGAALPARLRKGVRSGAESWTSPARGKSAPDSSSSGCTVATDRSAMVPLRRRASPAPAPPASAGSDAPARCRRPGRRRAGTSPRPNQGPALAAATVRSMVSMRPARFRRSRSRVPPAASPLAATRRVSAAPASRSRLTARSRAPARRKAGTRRASATQTRSRSANRGAATAAETRPAIRPVPSEAIRPESRALAPASSVTSRLSTTRPAPSDWMLAAMVPWPECSPAGP